MRKGNKLLSILLALALCLSLLPTAVLAEDEAGGGENSGTSQVPETPEPPGEEDRGVTAVTVDAVDPGSGTTVTVTAPGAETGTQIDVEHTAGPGASGPAQDGAGTQTTAEWSGETERDGILVEVTEGSETVTTTPGMTDGDGNQGTQVVTAGGETVTVTMPEETGAFTEDPFDPESDVEWAVNEGTDGEGWRDDTQTPGEPVSPEPETVHIPLPVETADVTLTPGETVETTVGAADPETLIAVLEGLYGPGNVAVGDDGSVTVTEITEEDLKLPELVNYHDEKPVAVGEGDFVPPEGFDPVYNEDGRLTGCQRTEVSEDGTRTTTTLITVTKSQETGYLTATQKRTVTTARYDLSSAALALTGTVSQFAAEEPADVTREETGLELEALARAAREQGYDVTGLTAGDAALVLVAIEAESGGDEAWSDAARAFYEYMTAPAAAAALPEPPRITDASVSLNVDEDRAFANTAAVSFTVEMTPSVTGDVLVEISVGEDTVRHARIRTDRTDFGGEDWAVRDNGDGTYTFTIYQVQLIPNAPAVDIRITTTEETVTSRSVVAVTLPPEPYVPTVTEGNFSKYGEEHDYSSGEAPLPVNDYDIICVKKQTIAYVWLAADVELTEEQIRGMFTGGPGSDGGNADGSMGSAEIRIVRGDGTWSFDNGASSFTVEDGILRVQGDRVSHINTVDRGPRPDAPEPTYDLLESALARTAGAALNLSLTGGTVDKTILERQNQVRYGVATVTQSAITTQEQIITELRWRDEQFIRDPAPTPPPTPVDPTPTPTPTPDEPVPTPVPDEPAPPPAGGGGGGSGGGGGGGGGRTTRIPSPPVPLAAVPVTSPAADIADEPVPLAEVPEVEVPLAEAPEEIPDESVPLADVPRTGDGRGVWYAIALTSLCGLAALPLKKREEEEA